MPLITVNTDSQSDSAQQNEQFESPGLVLEVPEAATPQSRW